MLYARDVFIMNNFPDLLAACGLSTRGAAKLLDVRYDTIRNWKIGRGRVPGRVMEQLEEYAKAAERIFAHVDKA